MTDPNDNGERTTMIGGRREDKRREVPAAPVEPCSRTKDDFKALYKLEEVIGKGGSGIVYRGRIRATKEQVAIKFLANPRDEECRLRFLREGHLLSSIRHPNVVSVIEVGEIDGKLYQIAEFVTGGTLRNLLDREGKLSPDRGVALVMGLLAGLENCHDAGIIHRDIKPENILLTGEKSCKLADLGVAKASGELPLTCTGDLLGTPVYMSPEHANGVTVLKASDLYSCGIVIYEMLCGQPPFTDHPPFVLLEMHRKVTPRPLTTRVPTASTELGQVVDSALAKDPNQRPASAKVMGQMLARCPEARA
jgi:serine/threonine protein kinase